jgi:hypothetical protein
MTPYKNPLPSAPWAVRLPKGPDGKRKTRYFKSRAAAIQFCRESKGKTINEILGLPTQTEIKRQLSAEEEERRKAWEFYQAHKAGVKPVTVREAVDEFLAIRQAEVKRGALDLTTVDSDRYRLYPYLVKEFGSVQLSELTPGMLERFFDQITINRRSIYKTMKVFFRWAKKYEHLNVNPMAQLEPRDSFGQNKAYYPVEVFERMLRVAAGIEAPKKGKKATKDLLGLLPWFVLSGFLGLRSTEAFRLSRQADAIRWSDLYFDRPEPFIKIRDEIAKQTARANDARNITKTLFLDAAKHWLNLCPRGKAKTICPWTKRKIQDLKRKFVRATGIKFTENGFRNSFATYAANAGIGIGDLAREMGNSESICKRYYVDSELEPGAGKLWFGLRPPVANVIQIQAFEVVQEVA